MRGEQEFTVRNVIAMVGVTAIVSASYPYMVLKMGIVPGMSIVSALMAYLAIGVVLRRHNYSARENNLVQVCATSGTSTAFMCTVIAALDMLGYVVSPALVFFWITASCLLGVFLAVPFRKHFIEVEQLRFADGVATAETLRVLEAPTGEGAKKAKGLAFSGIFAIVCTWLRDVSGIIADPLTTNAYFVGVSPSLMLLGSGMLIGIRVCLWMLVASLATWVFLAPWLVANGIGQVTADRFGMAPHFAKGLYYPVLMRWVMWPATVLMVSAGITAFIVRWQLVVKTFRSLSSFAYGAGREVSLRTIIIGAVVMTIALAIVQYVGFSIHPVVTVLGVVLSFPLMLVGIRAAGETNIAPVSVLGSTTQMIFGAVTPGDIGANMTASGTTGSIAANATDVMMDFKAGHLLGSTPRKMVIAQCIGVPLGALMVAITYPLLKEVYGIGTETLPAPTAIKWKAFSELLNQGWHMLPPGAAFAMGIAAFVGIAIGICEKYWPRWTPSAMGIGIAMLLPAYMVIVIALGGIIGAIAGYVIRKRSETYLVPTACGFIAGESVMGIAIPVLKVLGVI